MKLLMSSWTETANWFSTMYGMASMTSHITSTAKEIVTQIGHRPYPISPSRKQTAKPMVTTIRRCTHCHRKRHSRSIPKISPSTHSTPTTPRPPWRIVKEFWRMAATLASSRTAGRVMQSVQSISNSPPFPLQNKSDYSSMLISPASPSIK